MADHAHHHHDHGHGHGHGHGESYEEQVARYRAAKDAFFGSADFSPIPQDERGSFSGLPYYPIVIAYRFDGLRLEPYAGDEPSAFRIPTSDGKLRPAHRAGTLAFDLDGEPRRLTGYVLDAGDPESLFVPFLDATSGTETYGAGRYLDLEPEDDGSYILDFNLAYHPSCVYDARFSCPLTPPENRLPIRIEAGERLAEASTGH